MSKNVFISSFHLIWHSRLKKIQNFEGFVLIVSNVKDTVILILCIKLLFCLFSLEASRIFFFSPEFWNFIMMCHFYLFCWHLVRPFRLEIYVLQFWKVFLKYFVNDFFSFFAFFGTPIIQSFGFRRLVLFSLLFIFFCSTFWEISLTSTLKAFTEFLILSYC